MAHHALVLVGRWHRSAKGDLEPGGPQRAVLVVRDQRVERVEVDLVDQVVPLGTVFQLPVLDGHVVDLERWYRLWVASFNI